MPIALAIRVALLLAASWGAAAQAQYGVQAAAAGAIAKDAQTGNGANSAAGGGQDAGKPTDKRAERAWRLEPRVTVTETYTDNVELDPGDRKRGDLVTQLTPGIVLHSLGDRVSLDLDYRFNALLHARDSARDTSENRLKARGVVEPVDDWFFIEGTGSITQQNLSAFGPQGTDSSNVDRNRTEVSTYRLSPYVKGHFGSVAEYEARYSWSTTSAKKLTTGEFQTQQLGGSLKGITPLAPLTWAASLSHTLTDYKSGRDTEASRLFGTLTYRVVPQFRVSLSSGWETNDYASADLKSKFTYGAGFDWAPTPRTQVSAFHEERFFGSGHSLKLSHRTPHTAWVLTDKKDTETLENELNSLGQGTAFDAVFASLARTIPDPVARALVALESLRLSGIAPDALPGGLITRAFIQRRREASVVLSGVRNTVTLTAFRSQRQNLVFGAGLFVDDFNLTSEIQQRGFSAVWMHKLSGLSSLSLLGSRTDSKGNSGDIETSQSRLRLQLSTQLSPNTTGSLGLRHVRFDDSASGANSYRENAVTASLTHRF